MGRSRKFRLGRPYACLTMFLSNQSIYERPSRSNWTQGPVLLRTPIAACDCLRVESGWQDY